jgi:signal peptidase I
MGDNRNNSWDSRAKEVSAVDNRHILGKIIYRVMPYDRLGAPR